MKYEYSDENSMSDKKSNLETLINLDVLSRSVLDQSLRKRMIVELAKDAKAEHKLECWLAEVNKVEKLPGRYLASILKWLVTILFVLGCIVGIGFMQILVAFNGDQQVNIIWIVVISIAQFLLSLFVMVSLFRCSNKSSGFSELLEHWLPKSVPQNMHQVIHNNIDEHGFITKLATPYFLLLTQSFSLGFVLSAMLAFLGLITFQDIAFGWATTLSISPESFQKITSFISIPWSFIASAVPSFELIEKTQFYRLDGFKNANIELMSGWWPFLFFSWLFYAVIPRVIVYLCAKQKWNKQISVELKSHPFFSKAIDLLNFDYDAAISSSARYIADMIGEVLQFKFESTDKAQKNQPSNSSDIMEELKLHIVRHERECQDKLTAIYCYDGLLVDEDEYLPEIDNFYEVSNTGKFDLDKKEMAIVAGGGGFGAALGAGVAAGAAADVAAGGMMAGAGMLVGGAVAALKFLNKKESNASLAGVTSPVYECSVDLLEYEVSKWDQLQSNLLNVQLNKQDKVVFIKEKREQLIELFDDFQTKRNDQIKLEKQIENILRDIYQKRLQECSSVADTTC